MLRAVKTRANTYTNCGSKITAHKCRGLCAGSLFLSTAASRVGALTIKEISQLIGVNAVKA
jgi:hypothetical protein